MVPRSPRKEPAFAIVMVIMIAGLVGLSIGLLASGQFVLGVLSLALSMLVIYSTRATLLK